MDDLDDFNDIDFDPNDPLAHLPEHLLPKEEWYDPIIRYGLYLGAVFQLVCILAVVVFPGSKRFLMRERPDGSHLNASFWDDVSIQKCHM